MFIVGYNRALFGQDGDIVIKKKNFKDSTVNNFIILLVFAYLRHKINRRPNELKPEERTSDGIKKRRERIPDAYSSNIDNGSLNYQCDSVCLRDKEF